MFLKAPYTYIQKGISKYMSYIIWFILFVYGMDTKFIFVYAIIYFFVISIKYAWVCGKFNEFKIYKVLRFKKIIFLIIPFFLIFNKYRKQYEEKEITWNFN